MKNIALNGVRGKGLFAFVDDEDYELVSKYSWYLTPQGYVCSKPHRIGIVSMARLVTNAPSNKQIDHWKGNKLDNQKGHLRECTPRQNSVNVGLTVRNTSGYKGVSRTKYGGWLVTMTVKGKKLYIGTFGDARAAALAYNAAALALHGEFAWINPV
jgi:hypothetical protein